MIVGTWLANIKEHSVESAPQMSGEIDFHYEKSNLFRVIHVDGAIGSVSTSSATIHMAVYSERTPVPKLIVQKIENGILGPEVVERRVGRTGMYRELECDLVLSIHAAVAMRAWLDARIQEMEQLGFAIPSLVVPVTGS